MITYHEWRTVQRPSVQKLMAEGIIPTRVMKALQMLKDFPEGDIKLLVALLGVAGGEVAPDAGDGPPPMDDMPPPDAPAPDAKPMGGPPKPPSPMVGPKPPMGGPGGPPPGGM